MGNGEGSKILITGPVFSICAFRFVNPDSLLPAPFSHTKCHTILGTKISIKKNQINRYQRVENTKLKYYWHYRMKLGRESEWMQLRRCPRA